MFHRFVMSQRRAARGRSLSRFRALPLTATILSAGPSSGARVSLCIRKTSRFPTGSRPFRYPDSRRALGTLAKIIWRPVLPSDPDRHHGDQREDHRVLSAGIHPDGRRFSLRCSGDHQLPLQRQILSARNTTPESGDLQRILNEMADAGVTHVIAEVSSHALDLKRVDDCDFDLAVFTNLSPEHLDYHKDMEDYFRAKQRLFAELLPRSRKKPSV